MIFKLQKIKRITAIYFIGLFFLYRFTDLPDLFYIIACILYVVIPTYGALNIRSNFYVDTISSIRDKTSVVLTFNLSNSRIDLLSLLKVLDELEIKAMFFITGKFAEKNAEWLKIIQEKGHIIGNHSYDHSKGFGFYTSSKLITNLRETERLISSCTGESLNYFRPPFGVTNPFVQTAVKALKYEVIGWKLKLNLKERADNHSIEITIRKIKGGEIIFIDIPEKGSNDILRNVVKEIKQRNIKFSLLD